MPDAQDTRIDDFLLKITDRKPFIFLIIKFEEKQGLIDNIKEAADTLGMVCITAKEIGASGEDLLNKIHRLIMKADIVLADISVESANVFYEVGYACGINKNPILIVERSKEKDIPVDLKGKEFITYSPYDTKSLLINEIKSHIRLKMEESTALYKDMLESRNRYPNYILSLPKAPGKDSEIYAKIYRTNTYGDYLGIMGLSSAFGHIWGVRADIELVSPKHCDPDYSKLIGNLYSIGSSKVNPLTKHFLQAISKSSGIDWHFQDVENPRDPDDPHLLLQRNYQPYPSLSEVGENGVFLVKEDHGLIIRHPRIDISGDYMLMIIAAAHSLGTGAASVAATTPRYIKMIRDLLKFKAGADVMPDKSVGFWAVVKGVVADDNQLDKQNIEIVDCGLYK